MGNPSPDINDQGIADNGICDVDDYGVSGVGGNAERGTALSLTPDLETAFNNLRRCERYTIFLRDGWRYRDTYIDNPRPTGPPIKQVSAQYRHEESATKRILLEVYESENATERYRQDKAALAKFLTSSAQKIGLDSIEHRALVTKGLVERYRANKHAEMESLSDACARMLVFRTGMPLPFTIERQTEGQSPMIDELEVASAPNTSQEMDKASKEAAEAETPKDVQYPIPNGTNWIAAPTGLNAEQAAAYAESIREYARQEHIKNNRWRAKWGNWSDDPNDRNTPYYSRFDSIFYHYGIAEAEYHRKQIYIAHPITAILHCYIDPCDLADIIRLNSATHRNTALERHITLITNALEESRLSMKAELSRNNPAHVDWSQYKPLLQTAAAFVLKGQNDPLNSVCEVLYEEVAPWTWPDIFNASLMAVGILSICIFPFASPGIALLLGGLNFAMTFPGLGLALQQISEANEGFRQDNTDEQYSMISDDLEMLENKKSVEMAYAGLFLEILGAMPWGAVIKISRRSFGLADEAVETVETLGASATRNVPDDGIGHIDSVRMSTDSQPPIRSSVAHPDADFQPRIEMPAGPSGTYANAAYAPRIEMPRITAGERLPTVDEMSDFMIAKRNHDLVEGPYVAMPPSDEILKARAKRISDAEFEVIEVMDEMDNLDTQAAFGDMTHHQRYLQGKAKNERAINRMQGIGVGAEGRIMGAVSDLPEEVAELSAAGAQFAVHETSGNLHYKIDGQGWRLVFDELRNPPGNRSLAGYANHRRSSAWYEDLRHLWEMRGYARRTDTGAWEMLDPELKVWIPESHIQMGHVVSAVEHDQMMLRFVERARSGEILDRMGQPLSEAHIQDIKSNSIRTFMGDFTNYVPQYKWRNEELGRRLGRRLRYGQMNPDYVIGSSSRFKMLDDGSVAPLWHEDGKSILSWSDDGMQRLVTDENGVSRVLETNIGPDHLGGKDIEAYYEEISAIRSAVTQ